MTKIFPHLARSLYAVYRGVDHGCRGARARLLRVCASRAEALRFRRAIVTQHRRSLAGGRFPPRIVVVAYDAR